MATKEELESKTKEELVELARERDVEGRSGMNKEELVNALAEDDSSSEDEDRATNEGFAERLETVKEEAGEAHADLVADELDEKGPLHVEAPSEREMTGAVSEEQAEEQKELLEDKPDDYVGPVSAAGFEDEDSSDEEEDSLEKRKAESRVKQDDVIDFPPPLGDSEEDAGSKEDPATDGPFATSVTIGGKHGFGQKAVFYTDGISGLADSNLERAYNLPETLQSNDPDVRAAGDESESEAALAEKSEEEKQEAKEVKEGSREE